MSADTIGSGACRRELSWRSERSRQVRPWSPFRPPPQPVRRLPSSLEGCRSLRMMRRVFKVSVRRDDVIEITEVDAYANAADVHLEAWQTHGGDRATRQRTRPTAWRRCRPRTTPRRRCRRPTSRPASRRRLRLQRGPRPGRSICSRARRGVVCPCVDQALTPPLLGRPRRATHDVWRAPRSSHPEPSRQRRRPCVVRRQTFRLGCRLARAGARQERDSPSKMGLPFVARG